MDLDPTTLATALRRTDRPLIFPGGGLCYALTWSITVADDAMAARAISHHPPR